MSKNSLYTRIKTQIYSNRLFQSGTTCAYMYISMCYSDKVDYNSFQSASQGQLQCLSGLCQMLQVSLQDSVSTISMIQVNSQTEFVSDLMYISIKKSFYLPDSYKSICFS